MVPPGLQQPSGLGILNDAERRTILDRSAGVHKFGLAKDFAARQIGKAALDESAGVLPTWRSTP